MSRTWEALPCKGGENPHCCGKPHRFTLEARDAESAVEEGLSRDWLADAVTVYSCGAVEFWVLDPTPAFCRDFGLRIEDLENGAQASVWGGNIVPDGQVLPSFATYWVDLITKPGVRPYFETLEQIDGMVDSILDDSIGT